MHVIKRDGTIENVAFDKISERLRRVISESQKQDDEIDIGSITHEVVKNMAHGMLTREIDNLLCNVLISREIEDPRYGHLAKRILVSGMHKETRESVVETWVETRECQEVLSDQFREFVGTHATRLHTMLVFDRDYDLPYFGLRTMLGLYSLQYSNKKQPIERPQHVFLRVAIVTSGFDIERVQAVYDAMSLKRMTFGSPTMFNAGFTQQQLASCYLLSMDDSIDSIFTTFFNCAKISKYGGGLGVSISSIRGKGARISSNGGTTDGIIPMCRVLNAITSYINQSGRRKGSCAVYLDPSHPDIEDFLNLRLPQAADEDMRCRDLFLAMWIPDLFFKRVHNKGHWSLFDPDSCKQLQDVFGEAYEHEYERLEAEGKAIKTIPAESLFKQMIRSQIESGMPYMLSRDAVNIKSMQQNLGTVKGSNLCAEIVEYTRPSTLPNDPNGEIAVCNLSSIALPAFYDKQSGTYDFEGLMQTTRVAVRCLNNVIDLNYYPVEEARRSNLTHRPIGLGVQGLYDTLVDLDIPFDSAQGVSFSRLVAMVMYYAALDESANMAIDACEPYATFQGSPYSFGMLNYDLWADERADSQPTFRKQSMPALDWNALKMKVQLHGVRNSLLMAQMPTATSSSIFGNTESVEAPASFILVRRMLGGEYTVVNTRLVNTLKERGLWTDAMRRVILRENGSIQNIASIPADIRRLFRTAFDMKQRWVIDHARARAPYICQTQSTNLFFEKATFKKLYKSHMYAWKSGLKTLSYYIRSRPAADPMKITVTPEASTFSAMTSSTTTTQQQKPDDEDDVTSCMNCSA